MADVKESVDTQPVNTKSRETVSQTVEQPVVQTPLDLAAFNSFFKTDFNVDSITQILDTHKKLAEVGNFDELMNSKTQYESALSERNSIFDELGIKSRDELGFVKDRLSKASYLDGMDDEILTLAAARKNGIDPSLYFQIKNLDLAKLGDLDVLVSDAVVNYGMGKDDAIAALKEQYNFDEDTNVPATPKDKLAFARDVRNAKEALTTLKSKITPVSLQDELAKRRVETDAKKAETESFIKQNREAWNEASKGIKQQVSEWLKVKDDIIDFQPDNPDLEAAMSVIDNSLSGFLNGDIPHTKENVEAITKTIQLIARGANYDKAVRKAAGKVALETERKFHNATPVGNNENPNTKNNQPLDSKKAVRDSAVDFAKKQGFYST